MPFELNSLSKSEHLDNSKVDTTLNKLQRESQLLLGGLAEGTCDAAKNGLSSEHYLRTVASFGLAAALTVGMRRPGLLGNVARGAGTIGAANFTFDLANPRRLQTLGTAISDTWQSPERFGSSYLSVKKELGVLGFDTLLGVAGGAFGAGLGTKFLRSGLNPVSEVSGSTKLKSELTGLETVVPSNLQVAKGALTSEASVIGSQKPLTEPSSVRVDLLEGRAAGSLHDGLSTRSDLLKPQSEGFIGTPLAAKLELHELPGAAKPEAPTLGAGKASAAEIEPLAKTLAALTPPTELKSPVRTTEGAALKPGEASNSVPVSDFLRTIKREDAGHHYLEDYAAALENSPFRARELLNVGGDSISLVLDNGNVLKVTNRALTPEMGTRPFDAPILERGTSKVGNVEINYFVQPKGQAITEAQNLAFMNDVARDGWWFSDPGKRNSVFLPAENRVALVDPWAVDKIPSAPPGEILASAPKDLPPLNAFSQADELIGRQISNFADTPFTFKGKRYATFESFYQSLKFSDLKERSRVAKMTGKQAKEAGSKAKANDTTFDGKTFELGSPEHYAVLHEALVEKFLQNPQLARDFAATSPRPIVHDVGRPDAPGARFPAEKFASMLEQVRSQLLEMDLSQLGKRKK